jgi:hypothetical protein
MLTTRLVLILILVVMSTFGAQKANDRGLLLSYITSQLGISTSVSNVNSGNTTSLSKSSSKPATDNSNW